MKTKSLPAWGLCLVVSFLGAWANAEPRLNGLATNSEFGRERFIAALYTDNRSTDVADLFANNIHRRMEMKITTDSISARSINSMWIEGMAINNPSSALESEADNLAALNNMVRRRLREGDTLTFDAVPDNGMTVRLNDVELGHIPSNDFFNMVLRVWIGNIPLSTEFKAGLMAGGTLDADLVSRYSTIQPSADRIAAVEGWLEPAPAAAARSTQSDIAPPRPQVEIEAPPVVAAAPEPEPESAAPPTPAPSATPPVAAAPTPRPAPAPTPTPQPAPETADDNEEEVEEVMVTAESLLIRQRYVSDVIRQTLQNMRYPRRALERSQQGTIRLTVTVNRNGELQDVQILEESSHGLLNREATASVERASPFPAVPAGLAGDSLSFGIPVTFQLQ